MNIYPDSYSKTGDVGLGLLFEISLRLAEGNPTKDELYTILKMVSEHIGMNRVILTILNRHTSSVFIEVAYGLSEAEKARGKYNIGEGIIGRVVKYGKPVIIPKISMEPLFLNKTKSGKITDDNRDISFVCVPIKQENKIIGTLSINRIFYEDVSLEKDMRLLTIIATMITSSVRGRQDRMEEMAKLKEENIKLQDEIKQLNQPSHIIGNSGKMRDVYELISLVAPTNSTVLIRGQSGVGKELIAEAIHNESKRSSKPLVKVNCSALPDTLIESELFGHEKGAFTGAEQSRKGRFEMAHEGTIFLDEIGDLPLQTQVKLLRVLQQREFERIGGNKTIQVDVRVVAATNRNLEELIKEEKFREDFYYRLNVFPIYIPSLVERKNDIPALVDHFIEKFNKRNHASIKRITTSAIDLLMLYHWPGNVRELENCIERAAILSKDNVIRTPNLPPTLQTAESSGTGSKGSGLDDIIGNVEKQIIIDTLISTRGNMYKASEALKITERVMGLRIKKYNIDPKRFKINK